MPPYVLTVRAAFRGAASRLLALGRQVLETDVVDAAGTFIQSWAQTLAVGNVSGGTNPTISIGDRLVFDAVNQMAIMLVGASSTVSIGGTEYVLLTPSRLRLTLSFFEFATTIAAPTIQQAGTSGHAMTVKAQDGGGGLAGGSLVLKGGNSAAGNGGQAVLRGGTGTGTPGTAEVQHDDGALAIWVEDNGSAHTGGHAIHIGRNGLAFFDGTPADKPIVNGAKGGNAALTSLCSVLASMGLITDNTT